MKLKIEDLKFGLEFNDENKEACILLGFKPLNYNVSTGELSDEFILFYRHKEVFKGFFEVDLKYCTSIC